MYIEKDFEKRYRLLREILETIVLTVLMFLIIRLAVQNFNVDGMSMEESLHNQELILVDKWSYRFHTPTRGDVVVFVAPPQPDQDYIKRIIGLPGDIITINNGVPTVNGMTLKEFYVDPKFMGAAPGDQTVVNVVVPPNYYFVMGDNRQHSSDSRYWGCLPRRNIIGRAALIYWPFGRENYGLLPNVASVYEKVPPPPTSTGNPCYIWHNANRVINRNVSRDNSS
ncbi:MAG: signal peptidase I [Ktedonobacteraceae bacterium]|nr:signal peptidase I [Ktedonobacteraceae bacterium]